MEYIVIKGGHPMADNDIYPLSSDTELADAQQALRDAGLLSAPVYTCPYDTLSDAEAAGFDGETKTGNVLHALSTGDLVTGGELGTEDFDVGEVQGNFIAWEGSGDRTRHRAGLTVVSRAEADALWRLHRERVSE